MLSANTYAPGPVITGLLGPVQSSPLRLTVGLKLTAQRKRTADQKLLSAADTGLWQQLGKTALEADVSAMLLLCHEYWDVLAAHCFIPEGDIAHI